MKETLRRLAAWIMSLLMIFNGLPVTALADDNAVYEESDGVQLLSDAEEYAAAKNYTLYCYGLIPGVSIDSSLPADSKWYGLSYGQINTTIDPSRFTKKTTLSQAQLAGSTITTGEFTTLTINGITYPYAASEETAVTEYYYTVTPIRVVVDSGVNAGANNYFTVVEGRNTFHYDFVINLHEKDYYTVNFNVMKPDNNTYEALSDYSVRVPEGKKENELVKPDSSAVPQTMVYEGNTYVFDGWYKDTACTIKADFNGTIDANTNYYGRYLRQYTVTYTDGVEGVEVFKDQVYQVTEGSATPAFVGTPTRENYNFVGWKPKVDDTVTDDVTYVAQWERAVASYTVEYYLQDVGADGKPVSTPAKAYTKQTADTVTKSGQIGTTATYDAKTYEHYTFEKVLPEDRTILEDGSLVVQVYYTHDTADLTIVKRVTDDTTTERGAFTFNVSYQGAQIDSVILNSGNLYTADVTGLAVGETFTVTEVDPGDAWNTTVTPDGGTVVLDADGSTVTFTNSRTLYNGNGQLTVKKEWKDANGTSLADGYIPSSVQVQLYRQIEGGTATAVGLAVELTAGKNWRYTYTNLPATDDQGHAYTYSVQEVGVDAQGKLTAGNGYRFTAGSASQYCTGAEVTLTNTLDRVDVVITKVWELHGIDMTLPEVTFSLKIPGVEDAAGTIAADPDRENVYILENVPYRTDYTVDETMSGGTVTGSALPASSLFTPRTGVELTESGDELIATVTNTATAYGITISKTVNWADGMTVTIPAFNFTVDGETVATLQPVRKGVAVSTQVLVNSASVTVKEMDASGWNATEQEIVVSAGGTAAFVNTRSTLPANQPLSITKAINGAIPAMADDTFSFTVTGPDDLVGGTVTYTVGSVTRTATVNADHTFVIEGVKNGQTATVTSALPAGTYRITGESFGANNGHSYSANPTITRNGNAFTVTNIPVTGAITVQKLWQQPNGAAPATTAYNDAAATATFGLYANAAATEPLFTATTNNAGAAVFTGVPTGAGKTYYIKEISVSSSNYNVSTDVLTVTWDKDEGKFVLTGGNAITNTLKSVAWTLNLTKRVTNCTDADKREFRVKVGYTLPGGDSATEQTYTLIPGEKETVLLNLPIGTTVTVTEVLGDAANAWVTYFDEDQEPATFKSYTVSGAGTLDVTITNDRVLYDEKGLLTLSKTWVDSNNEEGKRPTVTSFADTLTLYSKAGQGSWAVMEATFAVTKDDDNLYTIVYSGLPAYDVNGQAMSYAVAEAATAPYTLSYAGETVTVATGVTALTSGSFVNTLEEGLTITKLWRNSEGTAIPAAQETEVELYRDDELVDTVALKATNDASMQTVTISVPKYDADGTAYDYAILEVGDDNGILTVGDGITYTVDYDQDTLTITNTKEQPAKISEPSELVPVVDEDGGIIDMVRVGDTIVYTIAYANYLPEEATVTITDVLPAGLAYVSSEPEASVTGQTVTWTLENVDALTSGMVTLEVRVTEAALIGANPTVSNRASIRLGGVSESTNTTGDTVYNPNWTVVKRLATINGKSAAGQTIAAGDVLGYTITVTNTGNCDLENLPISDALTVDGAAKKNLTVTDAYGAMVTAFSLSLTEGSKTFYAYYTVQPTDTALSNTATVGGKSSTVNTSVQNNPLWTVTKTVHAVNGNVPDSNVVKAGDEVTYAITVKNTGNCELKNLQVSDVLTVDGAAQQSLTVTNAKGTPVESFNLAKGKSTTVYAKYTVQPTDTTLSNTASVGDVSSTVDTTVADNPLWTVDKTLQAVNGKAGEKTVKAGDVVTYAITVKNTGNCELENLAVEDTFLVDGKKVKLTLTGSQNPADFTLAKGEAITFTADYTVQPTNTTLSNAATVGDKTSTVDTGVQDNPLWTVSKAIFTINGKQNVKTVHAGDVVLYTITVKNTGNCELKNLKVSDVLTVDGAAQQSLTVTNAKGTPVESFNLAKGKSTTVYAKYTVQPTDTTLSNTASVGDVSSTVDTTVADNPLWTVDKTLQAVNGKAGEKTVKAGDVVTYAITVTNTGNCELENLAVEDTFLVDGKKVKLTLTGSQNPADFTLAKGEAITFIADYTVQPTNTTLSNAATVGDKTSTVDTGVQDNPLWTVSKAIFTVNGKQNVKTVHAGDVVLYTITVKNTGNCELKNLKVSDVLTVDGAAQQSLTVTNAKGTPVESFNLAKGKSTTVYAKYTVQPTDTTLSNTASVGDVSSTVDTTVADNPLWTVDKTLQAVNGKQNVQTVKAGDVVTYAITVKNTGNCELENLAVEDTFLVDGKKVKLTLTGSQDPADFTLAKGEAITFTADYTVQPTNTTLSNMATVGDKSSTVDTGVQDNPLWTVSKAIFTVNGKQNVKTVHAGDVVLYTITVKNTGNCELKNLQVSDVLTVDGAAQQSLTVTNAKGTPVESFNLAKGKSTTVYAKYTVQPTDTTLSNTASVGDVSSTVDTAVADNPLWTVDKTLQAVNGKQNVQTVKAGDVVTYAITVKNTGNCELENLAVEDTFLVDGKKVKLTLMGSQNPADFTLAKGEAITFTADYTVKDSDTVLCNAVNVGDQESEVETVVEKNPLWTVEKKIDSIQRGNETVMDVSRVQPGDVLTYAITVKNTGNCELKELKVSDVLTVDGVKQELAVTRENGKLVDAFTLAKGETDTFYAVYTVTDTDTKLSNAATVGKVSGKADTDVEDNPLWLVEKAIARVQRGDETVYDLSAAGVPFEGKVQAGDQVTYIIRVANVGNCGLEGLSVQDSFKVDGRSVQLTLTGDRDPDDFALAKGEETAFTADYMVKDSDSVLSNAVKVGDKRDEVTTGVEDNPKWTLDKALADETGNPIPAGQAPACKPGDTVHYVITAVNTGNVALEQLRISDLFLVDGEDATHALNADAALTEPFGLAKGETKTFHASYVVKATDKVLSNTVTSEGKENQVVTEVEDTPAWTVTKYVLSVNGKEVGAEQTYNVGDKVTYAIVVTNTGNCDVKGLKAEDVLKGAQQTNLALTGTRGENPDSFTLPRYSGEEKQPGAVTFLAEYTIQKADKVVANRATVTLPEDGSNPEKGEAVITVEDYPDVELVKTVDNKGTGKNGAFRVGDTIRYKVEVRNTGNCRLENLKVEDVFEVDGLPEGIRLEPAAEGFALDAGESRSFCASYEIQATDTCLSNEATVSNGETESGDKVVITTEPNPAVTVLKDVTNIGYGLQGAFLPGDEVDYRVTVTNVGNCDLYDLKLTDSLYGDDTRLKITLPEEAASFDLMKGETIVFEYSYRTQEGYGLLVNTAKVLGTTSRVKTRIVTDQISPEAMPPACGYTSNVGDCFD